MKKTRLLMIRWLALMLMSLGAGVSAEEPAAMDAEALLKLVPRISLEEETIRSFQVKGVLDIDPLRLQFVLVGKQPDKLAMWVLDPVDGTPMVVSIGRTTMMYDPILMEVLVGATTSSKAAPMVIMRVEDDPQQAGAAGDAQKRVNAYLGFRYSNKEGAEGKADEQAQDAPLADIDIASFLAHTHGPLQVGREGDAYVLTGISKKKNMVRVWLDPSRGKGACMRMELQMAGEAKPALLLDEIVLNHAIADSYFEFPVKSLKELGFPVTTMQDKGVVQAMISMQRLFVVLAARLAIAGDDDSPFKGMAEKMSGQKVDWNKVKAHDAKISPVLKRLFRPQTLDALEVPAVDE